jgi:acetyl-CoA carboxylase carboxyl transferase subunit alpha
LYFCGSNQKKEFMATMLDFEKPISELLEQREKVEQVAAKSGVDVSKTIKDLDDKIKTARKDVYDNLTPWQRVMVSRHPDRPYAISYINALSDNTWIELHGDRTVKDDKAMVGGFGSLDGRTVMLLVNKKESTPKCVSIVILVCPTPRATERHCA